MKPMCAWDRDVKLYINDILIYFILFTYKWAYYIMAYQYVIFIDYNTCSTII